MELQNLCFVIFWLGLSMLLKWKYENGLIHKDKTVWGCQGNNLLPITNSLGTFLH